MSYSLSKKFTFGSLLVFALPTTIMMVFMSLDVYKRQRPDRGR